MVFYTPDRLKKEQKTRIKTGRGFSDHTFGDLFGFRPSNLIVVAGRFKEGKSMVVNRLLQDLMNRTEKNTLYFPFEGSVVKTAACILGQPEDALTPFKKKDLRTLCERIKIVDPMKINTLEGIKNTIQTGFKSGDIDIAVVDPVNKIQGFGDEIYSQVKRILWMCHSLTKKTQGTIILVVHPRTNAPIKGKIHGSHITGGSDFANSADTMFGVRMVETEDERLLTHLYPMAFKDRELDRPKELLFSHDDGEFFVEEDIALLSKELRYDEQGNPK